MADINIKRQLPLVSLVLSFVFACSGINALAAESIDFSDRLAELENLLETCENMNIPTDYERVNYTTIKRFEGYINEDISNNKSYVDYNISCIEDLYNEAKNNLEAYISGEKYPFEVTRADTSTIHNSGSMLLDKNGAASSIGFGHFKNAQNDVENFQDFGLNNIQMEIGPRYLKEKIPGWNQSQSGSIDAEMKFTDIISNSQNYSLKITNNTEYKPETYIRMYQNVACKPNTKYKFGCSSRGNTIDRLWMSANGYSDRNYINTSSKWVKNTFYYTTSNEQTSIFFQILSEGVTAAYLDDFYLIELDSEDNEISENMLKNPGLEETDFYKESMAYVVDTLENAQRNNIGVSLLLSPHYFPTDLEEDIYTTGGGFIKYNIHAEKAKEVIENYLRTLLVRLDGYSALQNICISNEPTFNTANFYDFYNPIFKEYLKQKHGMIEALNLVYKSEYSDFSEVEMPKNLTAHNAVCYDWIEFNDRVFTDWHKWMADIIKEYLPNVPLHCKMMGYFTDVTESDSLEPLTRGTDLELFDEFSDYAGNDTWDYIDRPNMYYTTMFLYDYQHSVTNKPVYNSEDHIIGDRAMGFTPEQKNHVVNNLWQGAVHGRNLSTIWVWERSEDPESDFYTSFLCRPDCIAAVGKTNLDLARLSGKVSMLQQDKPKIAVFYSKSARLYDKEYSKRLFQAYKTLLKNGFKVGVVSDKSIDKLSEYEVLIVPGAENAEEKTLDMTGKFIQNGGKVFYCGNAFSKNEYNNAVNNEFFLNNAYAYNPEISAEINYSLENCLKKVTDMRVSLIDTATGKAPEDIDWQYVTYDDCFLINLTNLKNGTVKNIEVYIDGKKIDGMRECISGKSGLENVTAVCDTPQLIEYTIPKKSEIENISIDSEKGIIQWEYSGNDFIGANVYLLKSDGTLEFNGSTENNLFSCAVDGTYIVRAVSRSNKESSGKIITFAEDKPLEITKLDCKLNNGYITCDISVSSNKGGFVSAVVGIQALDSDGEAKNYAYNKITFAPFAETSFKISMPTAANLTTLKAAVTDSINSSNLYSEEITKPIVQMVKETNTEQ